MITPMAVPAIVCQKPAVVISPAGVEGDGDIPVGRSRQQGGSEARHYRGGQHEIRTWRNNGCNLRMTA
ncbi:hypothetical protein [Sphaerisporangium krabiense]|uniref:Uncharacterized protein n=1 Tax=Sphaerisporangium krabiense TaxID=763782 RepID=A0A7W8Z7G1_9ACTN|nr:hypothetical protein [Sphaerisporangium krabiense]MBB5628902.1 hypothetical protein [Sphaerisporangium krabiense]